MYETCPRQQRSLLALDAPNFLRGPFSWAWSKRPLSHLDIGVTYATQNAGLRQELLSDLGLQVGEVRDVWILVT